MPEKKKVCDDENGSANPSFHKRAKEHFAENTAGEKGNACKAGAIQV